MGRHLIYRGLCVSACSVCLLPPALAQDNGWELIFGFRQSIETDDNLELDPVSEGRTSFAATSLSFGLTHETAIDRFGLSASGVARAADGPGSASGIDDQRVTLSYSRDGAQSSFSFDTSYSQSNIEFIRPLEDFQNEQGEIDLPPDLDDLSGTGNRERYQTGFALELGKDAPIGAELSANYLGLRYTDTTDPGLNDADRTDLAAKLNFRVSPVVTAALSLDYRLFESEDEEETRRETNTSFFDLGVELSPIWRLDAGLGYTVIDTREFGDTTRTDGLTSKVRVERDMRDGQLNAEFEQQVTDDGDIRNLTVGRDMELPSGALGFTVGLSDSDIGDIEPIGSLDWTQNLPRGEISAQLQRSVNFDDEDGNILRTALFVGYTHEINSLSSLDFNAGYTTTDESEGTTDRSNFSAAYQYELTEDWSLRTGYRYRMREELGEPRAESHAIFFNIGRDFVIRP